ncbi:MAG: hypothetical protein E7223_03805 [Clostridiales bacterium]|nr:hypothetical protein [Clostridiales bacterium]MBQ3107311.1 hypothetical protein [Bacillota bacterium]
MLETFTELSILYDFYGDLLPKRQKEVFRLYHEENYSLAEIAEEYDLSRQGVHASVKRTEEKLQSLEKQLGLVKRFREQEEVFRRLEGSIGTLLNELETGSPDAELFRTKLEEMAKDIQSLEE